MGGFEPGYVLVSATIPPFLRIWFRSHYEGLRHIPATGPAIVAANHVSYLDPMVVGWGVHRAGRRPRFLAKSELFSVPVVRSVLRTAGQIPVQRGTREAPQSLKHAEEALERGEVVVIFPEGTTTTAPDLAPLPPKTGVARLALATGAQVIPCATWGGQWFWTKHLGVSPAPGKEVWIRFGPPVPLEAYRDRPPDRGLWHEVSGVVMEEIQVLLAGLKPAKHWTPQEPRPRYLRKVARKRAAARRARPAG